MQARKSLRVKPELTASRTAKKRKRNEDKTVQTLEINLFPPEILSIIFIHCLPISLRSSLGRDRVRGVPSYLAQVCQRWRQVALSTPQLWASIEFDLSAASPYDMNPTPDMSWNDRDTRFAVEILTRSGSVPLSITITHDDYYPQKFDPNIASFLGNLAKYSSRLKALDICLVDMYLPLMLPPHAFLKMTSTSTHLESLIIRDPFYFGLNKPDLLKLEPGAILPSHLSISTLRLPIPEPALNWDRLTKITLSSVFLYECFEVLRHAHQLVSCSFPLLPDQSGIFGPFPPSPIVHPKLKDLHCSFFRITPVSLISNITLPSLTSLHITFGSGNETSDALMLFLTRSNCSLTHLYLENCPILTPDIITLLAQLPSLQTLALKSKRPTRYFSNLFIRHLVNTPGFLPNLENLYYEGWVRFSWDLIPAIFCRTWLTGPVSKAAGKMPAGDVLRPLKNLTIIRKHWVQDPPAQKEIKKLNRVANIGFGLFIYDADRKAVIAGDASTKLDLLQMFPLANN